MQNKKALRLNKQKQQEATFMKLFLLCPDDFIVKSFYKINISNLKKLNSNAINVF